jgi:EmrB/QacA subfamily drug resistance transporter
LTPQERTGVIAGLMLTLLLAALDQTIVGTAMPRIVEQLQGFDLYPWVTTSYMLTSTLSVPIFARLSDLYGRKWIYMAGAVLFVLASALCGASGRLPLPMDGMMQLIVFRGLQGIGGGIIMGLSFTIIGDLFAPAERGRYQGLFGAVFGLASVIGPGLGGWITDHISWRWTFYVNAPVGVIALVVLGFAFPHMRPRGGRRVVDHAGICVLTLAIVPLLLALTDVGTSGWTPAVMATLGFSAAMCGLFVWIEGRAIEPLLPLGLFRDRAISLPVGAVFMVGMGMFGVIMYIPLFLQSVQGLSAAASGQLFTPMMLSMIFSSVVAGQVIARTGRYKSLAIGGAIVLTVGMVLLSGLQADTARWIIVLDMIVCGVGMGSAQPIYTLVVQNAAPPGQMGAATAAVTFFRSIGSTLGVAVFGTVLLGMYHSGFAPTLAIIPPALRADFLDPVTVARKHDVLAQRFEALPGGPALYRRIIDAVDTSFTRGLHLVFIAGAILTGLVILANLFLPEVELRKALPRPPPSE